LGEGDGVGDEEGEWGRARESGVRRLGLEMRLSPEGLDMTGTDHATGGSGLAPLGRGRD